VRKVARNSGPLQYFDCERLRSIRDWLDMMPSMGDAVGGACVVNSSRSSRYMQIKTSRAISREISRSFSMEIL